MKFGKLVQAGTLAACAAGTILFAGMQLVSTRAHADDESESDDQLAAIGLKIAPSFINIGDKDPKLVGLGSFIVNAQSDCNGCHGSDPANEFVAPHNPYSLSFKKPAQYNQATYLNGGQNFGPVGPGIVKDPTSPLYGGAGLGPNIISRNLTPDKTGNPEGGNDLATFITIIRTGHDFDLLHLNCGGSVQDNCYLPQINGVPLVNGSLLQVMPWPKYQHMTDHQLTAIWTYLSTVPCNAHNDKLGDTFPWLKNTCQ